MGRGRKGVINQAFKKITERGGSVKNEENIVWWGGIKTPPINPPPYYLSDEFVQRMRSLNPKEVADTIVNHGFE